MLRALALCLLAAAPARACDTALLLAIDVSGSVDSGEYRLQTEGLALAIEDPEVADALLRGQVALAVVQWSGSGMQTLTIPWQRMWNGGDLARFADAARTAPRAYTGSDTAVGRAIGFAVTQFAAVPDCTRRVIDISGDGPENAGSNVPLARARAIAARIEINAIAIEDSGLPTPVSQFFARLVITPRGFVMTARGMRDYPATLRAKLLRELVAPMG